MSHFLPQLQWNVAECVLGVRSLGIRSAVVFLFYFLFNFMCCLKMFKCFCWVPSNLELSQKKLCFFGFSLNPKPLNTKTILSLGFWVDKITCFLLYFSCSFSQKNILQKTSGDPGDLEVKDLTPRTHSMRMHEWFILISPILQLPTKPSGQFIVTSAEVTPKGSLVRESYPKWPKHSG